MSWSTYTIRGCHSFSRRSIWSSIESDVSKQASQSVSKSFSQWDEPKRDSRYSQALYNHWMSQSNSHQTVSFPLAPNQLSTSCSLKTTRFGFITKSTASWALRWISLATYSNGGSNLQTHHRKGYKNITLTDFCAEFSPLERISTHIFCSNNETKLLSRRDSRVCSLNQLRNWSSPLGWLNPTG